MFYNQFWGLTTIQEINEANGGYEWCKRLRDDTWLRSNGFWYKGAEKGHKLNVVFIKQFVSQ